MATPTCYNLGFVLEQVAWTPGSAGQFYIHNADAGHESPIKIQVPMSLTFSPTSPLEEGLILRKATESLQRMR